MSCDRKVQDSNNKSIFASIANEAGLGYFDTEENLIFVHKQKAEYEMINHLLLE